jgi:serine/threonine-protein kinase
MGTGALSVYAFGSFLLNLGERRLTRNGQRVPLPRKAWQILVLLVEAQGRLVPHEIFRAKLWPDVVVEDRTLIVHMSTLRRTLANGSSSDLIETVPREGYRLTEPVQILSGSDWPLPGTQTAPLAKVSTLAVQPFTAQVPADANTYLGVGMADALATQLGGVPGLTVYPVGASAATANGQDKTKADHVLEGSIQLEDEQLRVLARLIDVASGRTQWSTRFEQPQAEAAALQDAIAERVADSLAKLSAATRDALRSYRPRSMEAFFLQMRGRAHLKPFTRLPLLQAQALFEQALALDPDYAVAHAGLASTYLLLASTAMLRPLPVDEAMALARRAAERAIALDSRLAEAWAALGRVKMEYDWDWDGAEADLAHAVALNNSSVEAHATFGEFLSAMGRHNEAIDSMERARHLDPRNVETLQHLGIVYWMAGRPEAALAAIDESLAVVDAPRAHYGRMMILDQLGRRDEAMAERLTTLKGLGLQDLVGQLTKIHDSHGWRAAMDVWLTLLESTNRWEGAAMQWMAVDEAERSLDALERCVKARTTYLCFTNQNPYFRPLRGNARFQRILCALKFEQRINLDQQVA